ncbi:MAG: hypothetical protein WCS70_10300 [Verrucomicrobiota bacterium]
MKQSNATNSPGSSQEGLTLWQRLQSKNISYFTLPLLVMATIVEFVILATGWKYQQVACLPKGMGVTFFGIGPIGATILAVELLKLPLAIWTASRTGWQKGFMIVAGLPLICVLTFQLVKDMAVYEMGVAMTPASQMLEKAATEEIKIAQLNGELAAIEVKKADRERKVTELAAKQVKAKADLEESLKRNSDTRQDAITLTEYQKKELSEVEARQTTIIKQFEADSAQLTKALAELRARRETEVGRATAWNAEEARIENAYKAKLVAYTNLRAAYEKDQAEYDNANFFRRQLMREPVNPGVPPVREANTILKPTLVAELDAQINAKEAELVAINNSRRDRVAQVEADARRVREDFDRRSSTKREESDRKREELVAAQTALIAELKAEEKQIDLELAGVVQKVDGIRAEADAARKNAEGYYEAREAAIKNTQVHRIATTVEIVRALVMGERPMSIKATAKERGDIYTDQISMVRIWVYPVLAFIVAFLPTLMVEIGFSTLFKPAQQRPPYRVGFFGRGLHWLYIRAGRHKILRAERLAREASTTLAGRDQALASARATAEKALAAKETELQAARAANAAASTDSATQLKKKEDEWVAKFAGMADSLNRAVIEKDALRDFQTAEIERQVQLRQNAWAERLTQLRQELDAQRSAYETERTALNQEQHKKLLEVTEDCKNQVVQARRQAAAAELAAEEKTAKLTYDLKEALSARDTAVAQWQQQTESQAVKLAQAKDDAAREIEKAARQEKQRLERQQAEFAKTLRQREEELSLELETRLVEEKTRVAEQAARREADLERQLAARVQEVDARWKQELQQREDANLTRLKQREQQLQAQAAQDLRRRESELERHLDVQSRAADNRLKQELQQKELEHQAKLKQREQELTIQASARETELQNQLAADLRTREEEWNRQTETRLVNEAQKKDEAFQAKLRQRELQLQATFDARQAELHAQSDQDLRSHEQEWERNAEARARATDSRWLAELQQKEELFQSKSRQRDEQWQAKLDATRAEFQAQAEQDLRRHEMEAADAQRRALRVMEANLRQEMQEKHAASQAQTHQREQELVAQLTAKAAAHQVTEQERDEARKIAFEVAREVQELKNKLMEASSLLTGWNNGNGKQMVGAVVGKNGH